MKVLIACLATETNSFAPMPTGRLAFETELMTREATKMIPIVSTEPLIEWRQLAEARGWEVFESLSAVAPPAAPTVRAVYEEMRDEILDDVRRERPDILLLSMHGAMMAQGYDDCEGDLLSRARAILGPKAIIGLEIDPHCHLTPLMIECADVIVLFKEYPHTDARERAHELFSMVADTAGGKIRPVMRDYDCRMISMYMTPTEPMRSFVDEMMAREGKDGVLHISLAHGFPWGDNPSVGTRMLVVTDGDAEKASVVAREFGERLWTLRDQVGTDYPSVNEALDRAENAGAYPVVLADFADNAGGGAPSDATYVLREVLDRGMKDVAIGMFWDPVLVNMCLDAGIGAQMEARVGGKIGKSSGDPVDLRVVVRGISRDSTLRLGDATMNVGALVWIEADGVHLILSEKRAQCLSPETFTLPGLDLSTIKVIVVKSSNHFYLNFLPIAADIIHMRGRGAISPDMTGIPLTKRDGNYWPKVADPFDESG
ncbi:M81 family metallopeptidase [Paracoccus xiamenensis]|uniref:M81 family metallopeptidase n=1 Tax=Paracoccus xiamenensis TaxID=2714901 RepID=UPI001409EFCC|nr:M81 family metallopeptidase [Paracoccus xiamenensis]NHF72577.1 M81 family metallopeptidase [Paracoccus xiamenensis]